MDQLDADIKNIEDKIPDITNLSTDTTLNAKIYEVKNEILTITNLTTAALNVKVHEVKNKIPNITILATTTALTVVENKILTVNDLVKKTDYNTKISVIENKITTDDDHDKYITTQEFYKFTAKAFTARLTQATLAGKSANFVEETNLNKNELN